MVDADVFVQCQYAFTICLFISPDLDGHRAPQIRRHRASTICFTICLFISPDLDRYRAPRKACFTICLFISPDLDGHRAPTICSPKVNQQNE